MTISIKPLILMTLAALLSPVAVNHSAAAEPAKLGPQNFEELHALIKRQPGESRWMEIHWYPTVWEARQKAAAEGKPIFLMAGSGGAPAAGC